MSKFVECFRKVINMADPMANSMMSKDMPPVVKILADWGRKACDEIKQLQVEVHTLKKAFDKYGEHLPKCPVVWQEDGKGKCNCGLVQVLQSEANK